MAISPGSSRPICVPPSNKTASSPTATGWASKLASNQWPLARTIGSNPTTTSATAATNPAAKPPARSQVSRPEGMLFIGSGFLWLRESLESFEVVESGRERNVPSVLRRQAAGRPPPTAILERPGFFADLHNRFTGRRIRLLDRRRAQDQAGRNFASGSRPVAAPDDEPATRAKRNAARAGAKHPPAHLDEVAPRKEDGEDRLPVVGSPRLRGDAAPMVLHPF